MSELTDFFERQRRYLEQWGPELTTGLATEIEGWSGATVQFQLEAPNGNGDGNGHGADDPALWTLRLTPTGITLADDQPTEVATDLRVRMRQDHFLAMMRGELDMLGSARHADRPLELDPLGPETIGLFARLMYNFATGAQCDQRFAGTLVERIYATGTVHAADGRAFPIGQGPIPFCTGRTLYELVRDRGVERTLEVGLAHGLSALFINQAHQDRGQGRHVAIDPFQTDYFHNIGLHNLEQAGLRERVELLEDFDYAALPRLVERGDRFGFAFLDGLHKFDYTLLDFFYADLLLEPGGVVIFDDLHVPAVRKVVAFILGNKPHYRQLEEVGNERIAVLEKTEDQRLAGLSFGKKKNVFHDF